MSKKVFGLCVGSFYAFLLRLFLWLINQPLAKRTLPSENNDFNKAIFLSGNQWVFIRPHISERGVRDEGGWLTVVDQS